MRGQLDSPKVYSVYPAGNSLCEGQPGWPRNYSEFVLLGSFVQGDGSSSTHKDCTCSFLLGSFVCVRVGWDDRTAALYILFTFNKDESKYCPNIPITKYAPNMTSTFVVALQHGTICYAGDV